MMMSTTISRKAALDAARAGGQAFRDGKSRSACPYGTSDVPSRFLGHYWLRGFRAAAEAQPAT